MPITLTYDLATTESNHRNYIRSMFERYGWQRCGGSTFRYNGRPTGTGLYEDWLNDVAPALMYFRSYVLQIGSHINHLTIDSMSSSILDHTDEALPMGEQPFTGEELDLVPPTNSQSSEQRLRDFVDAAALASVDLGV